ncbi:hypothetical protein [Neobacillus drentensis]|jgi:hypothetical protein|uniref:hypothetical protein n=1 Tax=Neobacillus drentensis TaxID=220684 RepID=UPI002FFEF17F
MLPNEREKALAGTKEVLLVIVDGKKILLYLIDYHKGTNEQRQEKWFLFGE